MKIGRTFILIKMVKTKNLYTIYKERDNLNFTLLHFKTNENVDALHSDQV